LREIIHRFPPRCRDLTTHPSAHLSIHLTNYHITFVALLCRVFTAFILEKLSEPSPSGVEYTIYIAMTTKTSVRSLVANLEKFTGKNEITVKNWCNLVDDAFSVEEWTEPQKLVIASLQLAGAAAAWYDAARSGTSPPRNWTSLKEGLIQRFGGTRSAAVARLEICRLRWKEGQDLEEHVARFTAIRSSITNATDDELVGYFRQTLPPEYLSDSFYREPTTLEEAISFARGLHASRRHGHYPILQPPRPADPTGPTPMDLDVQQLTRALHSLGIRTNTSRPTGNSDNRRCYRCGNRGHIARFCRQRQMNDSSGQTFSDQGRFRQFRPGPAMDAKTHRLAELAFQIEQQQPQHQQGPPADSGSGQDEPGKGLSQ
jgi:hypothetical protein